MIMTCDASEITQPIQFSSSLWISRSKATVRVVLGVQEEEHTFINIPSKWCSTKFVSVAASEREDNCDLDFLTKHTYHQTVGVA